MTVAVAVSSCTKNFDTINTNPNTSAAAYPQQLLAPALVNTLTYNLNRNRNFNNELMQVTVNISDADGQVFRYDFTRSWADYTYNGWYSQLTNFRDIYKLASDTTNSATYNKSYMGISLICQAWIFSMLTDTYGNVPFTQALLARDSIIFEPKFDSQKDIYTGIFAMLDSANTLLKAGTNINAASDPVYNGSVANWRNFGNSLFLRLLLRVSGKTEMADYCKSKIKDIVDNRPDNYPIITSNAQSAILKWTGAGAYISPLYSIRPADYHAPSICDFFINHLVSWNDPRIDLGVYGITVGTSKYNAWGIAPFNGAFVGVPSGYSAGTGATQKSYFYGYSDANSLVVSMQTEPKTGMMMNYAETQFILAECAAKGWINTGTAEAYYDTAVTNSITLWVPAWTTPVTTYLVNSTGPGLNNTMRWDNNASLDTKMELIHLQKYYALMFTDMQQWFEYRRTGHPVLPKGPGLQNGGVMPARMTYPVYVQSTNPTNYKAAVAAQGPDEINTQTWWQKP